jgi:methyl-accepting chemotaxis protein
MIATAKRMSEVLVSVSNGDLTVQVKPRSEQDTLGISLEKMTNNLHRIVSNLQGEVATLTSSSKEIVGSVSQVATGSAETAAAVAETTTSVEELKQTAHISEEKAKDVLFSADETLQIVNMSEKSLQMTINDMGEINDKMHAISFGIVKLSEHGQTIRGIIDSVNDLAEQSNVLAVNAAIEAAKAGEHGKSFSVVAQEIRTLAEQSKAATIQVRAILNDIQNATSEAVLATEQGSKAVEKGMKQSSETSEFMQKLIQSMGIVSEKAGEISDASAQQLIGVGQVTIAMNNIRDAAAQHVDHMKQIETAVVSLNLVGESLKEIADEYKIKDKAPKKAYMAG